MEGSSRWFYFGLGETVARRARKDAADAAIGDPGERPDDWKASDGPLPSKRVWESVREQDDGVS